MAHFTPALKNIIRRSFGDKSTALATAAGMHSPDISRLLREEAPLTAEKLEKLLNACELPEDRTLLVHAAVRDFVGEEQYKSLTGTATAPQQASTVQESLGGPTFQAHFPIHPRAEQVLRYILHRVQSDGDVEQALILLGKFLSLPEPLPSPKEDTPTPGASLYAAMQRTADKIRRAGAGTGTDDKKNAS